MAKIPPSIQAGYDKFSASLPNTLVDNIKIFAGDEKLSLSYCRLAGFNSLKRDVIDFHMAAEARRFFYEAHNDLLTSHINASLGSWRASLQALRSFLENTLSSIYFKDHPVELIKWRAGDFRISPKDLREYAASHPAALGLNKIYNIKSILDDEYSTLSKSVHAANDFFRMTQADGTTLVGKPLKPDLGKWSSREQATFEVAVVLVLACFKDVLDGAKLPNLRSTLSFSIRKKTREALREAIDVSIPDPAP